MLKLNVFNHTVVILCVFLLCFESLQTVTVKTDHDLSQLNAECPNITNKKKKVKVKM